MKSSTLIKHLSLLCAVTAVLAFGAGEAVANTFYTFTFSGVNEFGHGSFWATNNGDGTFTAFSGHEVDTINGVTESLALITDPAAPTGIAYSPSGAFWYDDKLIPGADPMLALGGLMFRSNGVEVNIWSTGADSYVFDRWQNGSYGPGEQKIIFDAVDPVPEPTTVALLGLGLFVVAALRRKSLLK